MDGQDFKRHSVVVGTFGRDYIKTGIFDSYLAKIIKSAFEMRTDSDYEDFYIISKTDVENQVKEASFFIDEIEKYINAVIAGANKSR